MHGVRLYGTFGMGRLLTLGMALHRNDVYKQIVVVKQLE